MEATHRRIREVLAGDHQYLVPLFQRYYSWTRKNWEDLWGDIEALTEDHGPEDEHFMGSLVCVPLKMLPGEAIRWGIIDGQQRITTIQLLLCAIRDVARLNKLDQLANEIQDKYIVDRHKTGAKRYKVVPRPLDFPFFSKLAEGEEIKGYSTILDCYRFFYYRLDALPKENSFEALKIVLNIVTTQLTLVFVRLGEKDNQYGIFETLNTRGLELEEADLIRNYIFMHVNFEEQEEFDNGHWREFESIFSKKGNFPAISITEFYRDYLMSFGKYVRKNEIYVDFKKLNDLRDENPKKLLESLTMKATFYSWLKRPSTCEDEQLRKAFIRLSDLDISTSYPLVLYLLEKYEAGELNPENLFELITALESFVIRRAVIGLSSKGYSRLFPSTVASIDANNVKKSLIRFLIKRGWPDDPTFISTFVNQQIYYGVDGKYRFILKALETSYGHREGASLSNVTIEHVMPQTIDPQDSDGQKWIEMLGEEWQRVYGTKLHTIGNLTLSAYNPEMSNKPFNEKKTQYANSNLELNKYFKDVNAWNEVAIDERGRMLAKLAATIWKPSKSFLQAIG